MSGSCPRFATATTRAMAITNPHFVPADDVAGLEIVREWRENVWRNAEQLVNAKTDEERAQVAADIQAYAAEWAQRDRGDAGARLRRHPRRLLQAGGSAPEPGRISVRAECEHVFVADHDPNLKGNVAELKIAGRTGEARCLGDAAGH